MKEEVKKIERPKIRDHFKESATLQDAIKTYTSSPELFGYAKDLDNYIDQIEQERDGLKEKLGSKIKEANKWWNDFQRMGKEYSKLNKIGEDLLEDKSKLLQELQNLKDGMNGIAINIKALIK